MRDSRPPQVGEIINDFNRKCGGRTRARTWDPLIKSQLLYQLSYAPFREPKAEAIGASGSPL